MRATGPAFRRHGDFLDGCTDDTQEVVTSTSALLVVAIGATVQLALGGADESDAGLAWHA
jgi:hypothetical protein